MTVNRIGQLYLYHNQCWVGTQFGSLEPAVPAPISKNQTGNQPDIWKQFWNQN